MALTLTFLGRSCDRWRVRVDVEPAVDVRSLTVSLVSERGRPLGPAVVAPGDVGSCWTAELRGPVTLPPGTVVRAVGEVDGAWVEKDVGVDQRRGLHAFLHADGRLPLDNEPVGAAVTRKEAIRLGRLFPWVCGCPPRQAPMQDALAEMLCREFDVDPADIDDEVLGELRR
jgi:hypothetical protein